MTDPILMTPLYPSMNKMVDSSALHSLLSFPVDIAHYIGVKNFRISPMSYVLGCKTRMKRARKPLNIFPVWLEIVFLSNVPVRQKFMRVSHDILEFHHGQIQPLPSEQQYNLSLYVLYIAH